MDFVSADDDHVKKKPTDKMVNYIKEVTDPKLHDGKNYLLESANDFLHTYIYLKKEKKKEVTSQLYS